MIKRLLDLIPEHRTYVEPYCGGAGLLFAKPPATVEVINDIDGELINFFQVVKHRWDELLREFHGLLHSRRWFYDIRDTDPNDLDAVQRAARFYFLRHASSVRRECISESAK